METSRELVAYGIIAVVFVIGMPWLGIVISRRRQQKLRRRGNKKYGH